MNILIYNSIFKHKGLQHNISLSLGGLMCVFWHYNLLYKLSGPLAQVEEWFRFIASKLYWFTVILY